MKLLPVVGGDGDNDLGGEFSLSLAAVATAGMTRLHGLVLTADGGSGWESTQQADDGGGVLAVTVTVGGEYRVESNGEIGEGLRILRSSTCGSSSMALWLAAVTMRALSCFTDNTGGKSEHSGDPLLVGVCAGDTGDMLQCGDC